MARALIALLGLLALGPACAVPAADDDDVTADDDDAAPACGLASNGSGGAPGVSWLEIDGFSPPGDGTAHYEVLVYDPPSRDPARPVPVIWMVGRRMPTDHAENENIVLDSLRWRDEADREGFLVILPNPGDPQGNGQLNWTDSPTDIAFFDAALDAVAAGWNVDLDRVHLLGSSAGGSAALLLGVRHADRVASLANHAGRNPLQGQWPSAPWERDAPALFIHDPDDPIVPREAVQDGVDMWEAAGQEVELWFDYPRGHEYAPELMHPRMLEFFGRTCNDRP